MTTVTKSDVGGKWMVEEHAGGSMGWTAALGDAGGWTKSGARKAAADYRAQEAADRGGLPESIRLRIRNVQTGRTEAV